MLKRSVLFLALSETTTQYEIITSPDSYDGNHILADHLRYELLGAANT